MSILFAFLRANWFSIACGIAVLIVLGYITVLKSQLNASRARESALLVNVAAKEAEIKQWSDLVSVQNASIDKMAKETAAARAKGLKAQQVAKELKIEALKHSAAIQQRFDAIPKSNDCADVAKVFKEFK